MADIEKDTSNQRLIKDCERIWREHGLPSGELRLAMAAVGDVADYANDPWRYGEYKRLILVKAVEMRAKEAAQCIYEDPDRRMAAGGRWNTMADAVGFPKHHLVRGGFWIKALGCAELVQQFKGTDEAADARVQAALDDWKAGKRPDGSALEAWFPRTGQPPEAPAESTGDPHLNTIVGAQPGEAEAVDAAPDPDAHAAELEQADSRRLNADDDTLMPCEVCGGTVVEGTCDTCGAHYLDGKLVPSALPPARAADQPAQPDVPTVPPALADDLIKQGAADIYAVLKQGFPNDSRQQLIDRYKELSHGATSIADRIKALNSVEKALDEVKTYLAAQPPAQADDDSGDDTTGAPVDQQPASNGWNGETSGDLIIRAQALARTLRGPETDIRIQPERLADIAWRSGLYPGVNSFERAFMIILEAIELGIPPTTGLKHIQVMTAAIKEKNSERVIGHRTQTDKSIHLMLAMAFASGELEDFSTKDGKVTIKRAGISPAVAYFNATGKDVEKEIRHAVRMILRQVFSDVLTFGLRVQKADANRLAVLDQGVAAA